MARRSLPIEDAAGYLVRKWLLPSQERAEEIIEEAISRGELKGWHRPPCWGNEVFIIENASPNEVELEGLERFVAEYHEFYAQGGMPRTESSEDEAVDTVSTGKVSSEMAEKAPESAGEPFYLNEPKNKDDWFYPIREMACSFRQETGLMPDEIKAWARLWDSPPPDFGITQGKDTGGEIALKMGGEYLSKSAFKKRWGRYTRRPK